MKTQSAAASDCGQQRETNEDRYFIDESLGLYIVCDGMGGQAAGEIAADRSVALAAQHIRQHREELENAAKSPDGYFRVLELAEEATQEASRRIYELASSDPEWAGMGTTMTLLLIIDNKAIMAHVGDSRLYLMRGGELFQLSTDHTLANELLQTGGLNPDHEIIDKYRHVLTRTIGQQEMVQVETLLFDLFPGDTCLLCSDGLSNYFDDHTRVIECLGDDELPLVPDQLVEFANSQGGADNITLIVLRTCADANDSDAADFQHRFETLKSTFLGKKLSASRLMRILNIASIVECPPGQEFLSAGKSLDGLYILLDGRVRFEDDLDWSEYMLPTDCLGESSLLRKSKLPASVVASETTRLMFIPRTEFKKLTRRLPKLGNALLRNLGEYLSERLENIRFNVDTITEE